MSKITFKAGDTCCLRYKQKESELLLLITADQPVGTDIDGTVLWPTVVIREDRQYSTTRVTDHTGTWDKPNYAGPYTTLKAGQVILVPAGKMVVIDKGRKK